MSVLNMGALAKPICMGPKILENLLSDASSYGLSLVPGAKNEHGVYALFLLGGDLKDPNKAVDYGKFFPI